MADSGKYAVSIVSKIGDKTIVEYVAEWTENSKLARRMDSIDDAASFMETCSHGGLTPLLGKTLTVGCDCPDEKYLVFIEVTEGVTVKRLYATNPTRLINEAARLTLETAESVEGTLSALISEGIMDCDAKTYIVKLPESTGGGESNPDEQGTKTAREILSN